MKKLPTVNDEIVRTITADITDQDVQKVSEQLKETPIHSEVMDESIRSIMKVSFVKKKK